MSNAFDTSAATAGEPVEIIAGDYTAWRRDDLASDYPPALYSLSYQCRSEGTPARRMSINAAEDNGGFLVELSSSVTAAYLVANYHWSAYITRLADSARVSVGSGIFTVQPDKATDSSDPRSLALKMLAHIEAALLHRASNQQLDVLAYTMGDDASATRDPAKLLEYREYWQAQLNKENRKARARKGLGHSAIIRTRF